MVGNTVERIGVDLNPGLRVPGMLLNDGGQGTRLSEEVESEVRPTSRIRHSRLSFRVPYAFPRPELRPDGYHVRQRNADAIAYRKSALELCRALPQLDSGFHETYGVFRMFPQIGTYSQSVTIGAAK